MRFFSHYFVIATSNNQSVTMKIIFFYQVNRIYIYIKWFIFRRYVNFPESLEQMCDFFFSFRLIESMKDVYKDNGIPPPRPPPPPPPETTTTATVARTATANSEQRKPTTRTNNKCQHKNQHQQIGQTVAKAVQGHKFTATKKYHCSAGWNQTGAALLNSFILSIS